MGKSTSKSTSNAYTKEDLFDNFYFATKRAFEDLESRFQIEGVADLVFVGGSKEAEAKKALRENHAWQVLSDLYEYAINGIDSSEDEQASFIVTEGAEVLELVTTHECAPSMRWEEIVWMADGRFALDEGQYIDIRKLALLANVDIRTVRNAISAGELESFKNDAGIFIENAPARRWLHGRRGFKPTVVRFNEVRPDLTQLKSPIHIGAYFAVRREQLNKATSDAPAPLQGAIEKIEAGIFDMSLGVASPLADFYQVSREDFLHCVMRVFFGPELDLLGISTARRQGEEHDETTHAIEQEGSTTQAKTGVPKHPSTGNR